MFLNIVKKVNIEKNQWAMDGLKSLITSTLTHCFSHSVFHGICLTGLIGVLLYKRVYAKHLRLATSN